MNPVQCAWQGIVFAAFTGAARGMSIRDEVVCQDITEGREKTVQTHVQNGAAEAGARG